VAEALGVSVTTVKRWVDDGILVAHKTAGGHRKLLASDVLRFARGNSFPDARLAGLEAGNETNSTAVQSNRLLSALRDGQADVVRALIMQAYQAGTSIAVLADEVIAPAMRAIGDDWKCGRIDVYEEHRGTQLCVAALYELKAAISPQSDTNRPRALGGCMEFDHYILPSLLAQMVLLDGGWEAVNLGPNTPAPSFVKAIRELRPKMVWLSASFIPDPAQFLRDANTIWGHAEKAGAAVAIGGQALTDDVRRQMRYTAFGDGLVQFQAFARTLHAPAQRPPRGRPPGS